MSEVLESLLWYLLPGSLLGLIGLYVAWVNLPPQLHIEGVSDKSKKFNTKSRIIIKNIGKLPAYAVTADAEKICAVINTNRFINNDCYGFSTLPGKLAAGESSEISISPGVHVGGSLGFDEFSYFLTLKYHVKVFGLKMQLSNKWKVELSNYEDGYSWITTSLE